MNALRSQINDLYDSLTSTWSALAGEQQLAVVLFVGGVLLLLLALRPDRSSEGTFQDTLSEGVDAERAVSRETTEAAPVTTRSAWLGGLQRTRSALAGKLQQILGSANASREEVFRRLEELLITSDLGVRTTQLLLDDLRKVKDATPAQLTAQLRRSILEILRSDAEPEIVPDKVQGEPLVIAVIGVNGVGKTTTIGKLAWQFGAQGKKVLIAAGDTFRAAAEQQLQIWADRAGAQCFTGAPNAKPSTVAYEAVHKARKEAYDVLIVDTAGRLHTRVNLMNELQNVLQILSRELPGSPHETILVVDASTGQNALQQAIDFNACAPLTGIIVTKLDGTPKGGIIVAISNELKVPIRYVGIGEQAADLRLFSAEEFTEALFADVADDPQELSTETPAEPARVVRRQRPQ